MLTASELTQQLEESLGDQPAVLRKVVQLIQQNNQHTINTLTNTLKKTINQALNALQHHLTTEPEQTNNNNNPNIHPTLLEQPTQNQKRKRTIVEYDDALLDQFSIPDHLSYSQYLKRSQHRTLNLLHSISLNPTQQEQQQEQSEQEQEQSTDIHVSPNHHQENHPSFLPNPALLENYFKPCPSGSKSSRRQSAILRNLVSAALGKLISHVTNNQQMHWPGSDTEERLAAIGLQIELVEGSKLTAEVMHKGPKNLQLQQCKRILLELELGLIRLKQIKAVPRPLRGSKKKFKPLNSPNPTESYHPISSPTTPPDILANPVAGPSTSSASSSSLKAADQNHHPNQTNSNNNNNVLGKNFENCDPALLALGPSYLPPVDQASSKAAALPADDSTNHRELVHRYITSNRHPNNNNTPFIDPPSSSSAASSSSSSSSSILNRIPPPLPSSSSRLPRQTLLPSDSIHPLLDQVDHHSINLDLPHHHHSDAADDSLDDPDEPRPSSTHETHD